MARRSYDDDDNYDEGISSRKRSGGRARDDDYDDEDDYDRPRKRKKAGSSKGLIIGLSVGGGILVIAIVGIVLFFVLKGGGDAQKLLVGTWQMDGPLPMRVQFTADGTLTKDLGPLKLNFKYRVINASTIEVDVLPGGGFGNFFPKGQGIPDFKMPEIPMNMKMNISVHVTQNELSMTENGVTTRYRRVN